MDNSEKKILIAEDEKSLRFMLTSVFRDEDFQVDEAADGNEAWELINKNQYDLLLADMFMPHMNGIELIQKCQEFFPEIKVVLLSGGGRDLEAEHGESKVTYLDQEIKVDMFMKKPCKLAVMLSIVEELLE